MPGPFPGMDPYLEDPTHWQDVHQRVITYIADALQPRIRPRYHARMGERVYIQSSLRSMYPDVTVIRQPVRERAPVGIAVQQAEAAVDEEEFDTPLIFTLPPVEHREPYVEIVHAAGGEVVTAIEVLSPANKTAGKGRRLYRRKQREILRSETHLMEIDLLSEGLHAVAFPEEQIASLPTHRYLISVYRASDDHRYEVYPIPLQRRLPGIQVPLREPDPDVELDLQAVFNKCYDNGGYEDFVDYRQAPPVALSPEEAAWTDGLLKGKGLRESDG